MLKINAVINPSTMNSFIKCAQIKMINALITSKNNPKVRIVTGIVRIINKGFKNVFSSPKTIATSSAVVKSATCTPGKK